MEAKIRRREVSVVGVDIAEEMVGDAFAFVNGHLVGGNVEASVNLYFVRVDDFRGGKVGGDVDGEARFAGAGAAHNDDDLVLFVAGGGGVHARRTVFSPVGVGRERGKWGMVKFDGEALVVSGQK